MFKNVCEIVFFSVFVLMSLGCSGASSVNGGLEPVETIVLDETFTVRVSIDRNEVFALDMHNPIAKGYRISGAFFDPNALMMDRFIDYDDDGEPRVRYLFTGLADGVSDVLIKMTPVSGGDAMVYKEISVKIGGGRGLFD